jgi:hypothetical protein
MRWLRHYRPDDAGDFQPVPTPPAVVAENGSGDQQLLHLELARVWAAGLQWWTLAYEANCQARDPLGQLLAIARRQLNGIAAGRLPKRNSFGYPHWLANHIPRP